ncbi:hypothetical protein [Thiobacter aerophilum]|uniref:Uncharacterized protein n=1 Tax=Thiobacter aerophilum TaxID=3121275 RepID=A0ABV0EDS0_9BURK
MPARILLNLSAPRVTWGVFHAGRLGQVTSLPNDGSAQAPFLELLAAHPRRPVYVMLDVVEEDFRVETLPHAWGRARREMVERKLAQYFRTTPYRAACLQGRVAGRRRDDQYLFMALTSQDLLRPWLARLAAQNAPLAGIYLLPSVSTALVARLDGAGARLLVSRQSGGLRQSLFVDGHLRISRLTPLEDASAAALEGVLPEEMEKSRLFFYNTRLLARDAPLLAWVLDPTGELAAACRQVPTEPGFRCEPVGAERLARAMGLPTHRLPHDMDALMLCLLGRHVPACNLAQPQQVRGFVEQRLRRVAYGLAASIACLGVAYAGGSFYQSQNLRQQAALARAEANQVRARYEDVTRTFPAAPATAGQMRAAVETVAMLNAQRRTPEAALRLVGGVLPAFPQVKLVRFAWNAETGTAEQIELSAEIHPFDGDYRVALALIQRLADSLRAQAGVKEVNVVELPVNLDPKTPLSGNSAEIPASASAPFRLALRLERAP